MPFATCAEIRFPYLQSRQFPAGAGNTGTYQGLVVDEPEGQEDEGRSVWAWELPVRVKRSHPLGHPS